MGLRRACEEFGEYVSVLNAYKVVLQGGCIGVTEAGTSSHLAGYVGLGTACVLVVVLSGAHTPFALCPLVEWAFALMGFVMCLN